MNIDSDFRFHTLYYRNLIVDGRVFSQIHITNKKVVLILQAFT